jgi:transcription-repair coupling factor (superfamily II helicase)
MEMIQEAVQELSGEPQQQRVEPDLKIPVDARLPVEYVADERLRLRFYKRLAGCRDLAEVGAVASELADRFGRMPESAATLVVLMRIKVMASDLGIASVVLSEGTILLQAARGHEDGLARVVDTADAAGMAWAPGDGPDRLRVFIPGTASAPHAEILQVLLGTARQQGKR